MTHRDSEYHDQPLHFREPQNMPSEELSVRRIDDDNSSRDSVVTTRSIIGTASSYHFNPFNRRRIALPTTKHDATMHMIKGSLGFGLFAMPLAFKYAGLYGGLLGTTVICLVVWHCMHILVKTSHDICTVLRFPMLGYSKTVELVLEMAPSPWPKQAFWIRQTLDFIMIVSYLSTSYVYIVIVSRSLRHILFDQFSVQWSVRKSLLAMMPGFIVIGQIRHIKVLVPFSMVANVFLTTAFLITIYLMLTDSEPTRFVDKPKYRTWETLPNFISLTLFSMDSIGAVMPIANSMHDPSQFLGCPGVLNLAMGVLLAMFLLMGFLGYATYGDDTLASVTLNLRGDTVLNLIVQYVYALGLVLSFGLFMFIIMDILWPKLSRHIAPWWHTIVQVLIRLWLTLSIGTFVFIFPNVINCMDLIGSIFFPFLGIIIPSFVQTMFLWPDMKRCKYILYKNLFLFLVAVVVIITGSYASIKQIAHQYRVENIGNFGI